MKGLLEICCGSFEDVKTAWQNGADRVELNSALYLGGLTPSTANLICAKEQCSIPIITMVRPRGGGFCYSQDEYETMLLDARILLEHGADGIAFGFLTENHAIHRSRTQEMIDIIHSAGKEAVFHRAFDCVAQQERAVEALIIHAKDGKVEDVENALNAYRDSLVNDTMQYPMNLGKIQASRVERIGDYVCFVQLGADTSSVEEQGDEAVITYCQEQNELALEAIRQTLE